MFPGKEPEAGITKNIKVIEWLKADLLSSVSIMFKSMLRGSEDKLLDSLAGIIVTCYVLGRRLGISFSRLELKIENKLREEIQQNHEMERWYGDLSALLSHQDNKKKR